MSETALAEPAADSGDLLEHIRALRERNRGYEAKAQRLYADLEEIFDDPTQLFVMKAMQRRKGESGDFSSDTKIVFVAGPMVATLGELRKFIDSGAKLAEVEAAIRIKLEEMGRRERRIDVLGSPEWVSLRDGLFTTLQPYPEALMAFRRFLLDQTKVVDVAPESNGSESGAGSAELPAPGEDPSS
jgi:hypothetical protein